VCSKVRLAAGSTSIHPAKPSVKLRFWASAGNSVELLVAQKINVMDSFPGRLPGWGAAVRKEYVRAGT